MRLALVSNPKSGTAVDQDDLVAKLETHGATVECFAVDEPDAAARCGADRMVVAGGDGSIAPSAAAAGASGIPLAVIPTGTANDFARALDLPRAIDAACELAAGGTALRTLDLGRAGERPFVNVANAGLAVRAAREARGYKKLLGPFAYAVGAARAGLASRPLACRVACDGEELFAGSVWQLVIGNTGAFGGGSGIAQARPDDGLLDVVAIEAGSRVPLLRRAAGLRSGRIAEQPGVVAGAGRRIDVEVPAGTPYNVDGEIARLGSVAFQSAPAAFRLVVP